MKDQYWLAEIGIHGIPDLIDGPHSRPKGAHEAMFLLNGMGLSKKDAGYQVAHIQFYDVVPDGSGVNIEHMEQCRSLVSATNGMDLIENAPILEANNVELRRLLAIASCPECDGTGVIPHGYDGQWEFQQCQFCFEREEAMKATIAPANAKEAI